MWEGLLTKECLQDSLPNEKERFSKMYTEDDPILAEGYKREEFI